MPLRKNKSSSESNEQLPLLSNTIPSEIDLDLFANPFYEWVSSALFSTTKTKSEMLLRWMGVLVGLISSYVFLFLGGEFGNTVANWLKLDDNAPTRSFAYWFCAVNSILPIVSLGISSSQKRFSMLASSTEKMLSEIKRKDYPTLRLLIRSSSLTLSVFAGIQRAYLTGIFIPNTARIKYAMSGISWLGTFIIYFDVFKHYEQDIVNRIVNHSDAQGDRIVTAFSFASKKIASMSLAEIETLYHNIFLSDKSIKEKLKLIYQLGNGYFYRNENKTIKRLKLLGIFMGCIASYAYYDVGKSAGNLFCQSVSAGEKSCLFYETFTGTMTAIPIALMYGITSSSGFTKVYYYLKNHTDSIITYTNQPTLRKVVNRFALFEGFTAGIPAVYLTIAALKKDASQKIFIPLAIFMSISAFLAHCSFTSFAVKKLFLDLFDHFTKTSQDTTINIKRDRLLTIPNTLFSKLPQIKVVHINELADDIEADDPESIRLA